MDFVIWFFWSRLVLIGLNSFRQMCFPTFEYLGCLGILGAISSNYFTVHVFGLCFAWTFATVCCGDLWRTMVIVIFWRRGYLQAIDPSLWKWSWFTPLSRRRFRPLFFHLENRSTLAPSCTIEGSLPGFQRSQRLAESRSFSQFFIVPHITVCGSCFSLCTRRSFRVRPPRPPDTPPLITHISHPITSNSSHSTTHHNTSSGRRSSHTTSSHSTHHSTTHHTTCHSTTHHTTCHSTTHHTTSGPQLAFVWHARYAEPSGGAGARVGAGPRLAFVWQAQYTESSGGAGARVGAAGPRLAFMWQAQYTEPSLVRAWAPLGRRWLSCGRRSTQSLLQELLRAWSPLARGWLPCGRRGTQSLLEELLEELLRAWAFCVAGVALGDIHAASGSISLKYDLVTHIHTHTTLSRTIFHISLSHAALSHTTLSNTTLSHTTFSHTSLSHTTLSPTALSHTHTQLCHPQLCHPQVCHTHTQLCHPQLCHTQSFTHISLTCNFSLTHIFVTHNFVTHTQLCHTHNSFTHNFIQLCHRQSFTHNFVTRNLSHTTLSHTHTQSFTHSFVTDNLSHTTLSLTTFHTQPFHRHTTFSHKTLHIEIELLKWLTLHHLLCLFFFLRATATTFSDYWKKLTCGVIRSFYFSTSQCPKIHISQHVPTPRPIGHPWTSSSILPCFFPRCINLVCLGLLWFIVQNTKPCSLPCAALRIGQEDRNFTTFRRLAFVEVPMPGELPIHWRGPGRFQQGAC